MDGVPHSGYSKPPVKGYIKRVIDKLGAKDRTPANAIAVRRGIIQL
jgi:DNA-binding NarL/FixJ family response regulator